MMRSHPGFSAATAAYASTRYRAYVLALLFLTFVFTSVDRSLLMVLVEPIKRDLGLTDSEIGILAGPAFGVAFVIAGLPLGLLADRGHRVRIMSVCLCVWSVATALVGFTHSFLQLLAARAGVGIGEAGGPPTAVSMISDMFPAARRATAISILYLGQPVGLTVAFAGGALLANAVGWRATFVGAGVAGVLVALLIAFTAAEPRGQEKGVQHEDPAALRPMPAADAFKFMLRQRSLVHLIAGLVMFQITGTAIMAFSAAFMIRAHHLTGPEAGFAIALCFGLGNGIGVLLGGIASDRLQRRDVRWPTWLGVVAALGSAIWLLAFLAQDSRSMMLLFFLAWCVNVGLFVAPTYRMCQSLVKPNMRATVTAVQGVLGYAVGGSIGPTVVGIVSDLHGADARALTLALSLMAPLYLWAAVHYLLSGRELSCNLQQAQMREPPLLQPLVVS